jgi:sialic acid synthase SpsE
MRGKVEIIAEIGNTHEGSVGLARQFIKAAAASGVDAVKFQTHIFEAESLPDAPNPPYFQAESRKEYFERTAFTAEQWKELVDYARDEEKVGFLSSVFSLESVDLLEKAGVRAYKIPSGEVSNLPLLVHVAATGKRVLLSSGMSSWRELDEAVAALKENGCEDLVVLQCTSRYPCPPGEAGLNVIAEMAARYGLPVGYSDHTDGIGVALAAVVRGASVIEKHFTLSRLMYGSDASLAAEPAEFAGLVREIRAVEEAQRLQVDKDEAVLRLADMKRTFEKSIVAAEDIASGTVLTENLLAFKKPGDGIPAREYKKMLGRTVVRDCERNRKFTWEDVEPA